MKRIATPQTNWKKLRAIVRPYYYTDIGPREYRQLRDKLSKLLGLRIEVKHSFCFPGKEISYLQIEAARIVASPAYGPGKRRFLQVTLFGAGSNKKPRVIQVYSTAASVWDGATESFLDGIKKQELVSGPQFQARLLAEELEAT